MSASVAEILRAHGLPVRGAAGRQDTGVAKVEAIRVHLRTLAEAEARDPALVRALTDAFLRECVGLDDSQLHALLALLADGAHRKAGRAPVTDTAGIRCQNCGPVFVCSSLAACLPVGRDGWPVAFGCPWCFMHNVAIPRPTAPWRTEQALVCPGCSPEPGQLRDART